MNARQVCLSIGFFFNKEHRRKGVFVILFHFVYQSNI